MSETAVEYQIDHFVSSKKLERHNDCVNQSPETPDDKIKTHYQDCGAEFSVRSGRLKRRHLESRSGEKSFKCEHCDVALSRGFYLKRHLRIHTGEWNYKCKYCGAAFSQSGHRKAHVRIHTGEKNYVCQLCDSSFSQSCQLKRHLKIHKDEKDYKCEYCYAAFSRSGNLKNHTRNHNLNESVGNCISGENAEAIGCLIKINSDMRSEIQCVSGDVSENSDLLFPVAGTPTVNDSTVELSGKVLESCAEYAGTEIPVFGDYGDDKQKCDVKFAVSSETSDEVEGVNAGDSKCVNISFSLFDDDAVSNKLECQSNIVKQTKEISSDKMKFKCHDCDIEFSRSDRLKRHFQTHLSEKNFKCEHCDAAFARDCDLKKHIRIHTGERSFKCNYCGRAFLQSGHLKTHIQIHTGEKKYSCEYCDYAASRISDLKRHVLIHSDEKNFKFEHCGVCYSSNGCLKAHTRNHTLSKSIRNCSADNIFEAAGSSVNGGVVVESPACCQSFYANFQGNETHQVIVSRIDSSEKAVESRVENVQMEIPVVANDGQPKCDAVFALNSADMVAEFEHCRSKLFFINVFRQNARMLFQPIAMTLVLCRSSHKSWVKIVAFQLKIWHNIAKKWSDRVLQKVSPLGFSSFYLQPLTVLLRKFTWSLCNSVT